MYVRYCVVDLKVFNLEFGSLTTFPTTGEMVTITAGIIIFLDIAKKNHTRNDNNIFCRTL